MIMKHPLIFSVTVNLAQQHQSSVTSHLEVSLEVGGWRKGGREVHTAQDFLSVYLIFESEGWQN
jgi:hypothetical protein